jgi:NAD(P)H-hydrate epimerase
VLLKGYRSLITDPGGHTIVNLTGNPGLATAGSGDVLTGIIGGLLARGTSVANALVGGAYVHGLAGDLAAAELGETSLVATDITAKLPEAIHSLRTA